MTTISVQGYRMTSAPGLQSQLLAARDAAERELGERLGYPALTDEAPLFEIDTTCAQVGCTRQAQHHGLCCGHFDSFQAELDATFVQPLAELERGKQELAQLRAAAELAYAYLDSELTDWNHSEDDPPPDDLVNAYAALFAALDKAPAPEAEPDYSELPF